MKEAYTEIEVPILKVVDQDKYKPFPRYEFSGKNRKTYVLKSILESLKLHHYPMLADKLRIQ